MTSAQSTMPHYKRWCKKTGFTSYHSHSEVFFFKQMSIAQTENINEVDTCISNLFTKFFSIRKYFGTVLTEEIRTAKLCTEVFVKLKHLLTKFHIPESLSYMSPFCAIIFIFNNIAELLWCGKIFLFLHLHIERGVAQCGGNDLKVALCWYWPQAVQNLPVMKADW